jgi:hypothetical protein
MTEAVLCAVSVDPRGGVSLRQAELLCKSYTRLLESLTPQKWPARTNTPACSRCSLQHPVCTPGCSTSANRNLRIGANRNFKRPFSPTINLSLSRRVVNRNQQSQSIARVWGENCGFAASLRAMHWPEVADFETVWTLARVRAEREGRPSCRTGLGWGSDCHPQVPGSSPGRGARF